ncbi:MAG: winged helix-turn-helix domain-containing protein [Candidatus Bathyarchaeia archaeon]
MKCRAKIKKFLADEKEHSLREVTAHISQRFNLSEEEKRKLLPRVRQPVIYNRVGWARTYLKKAGLLDILDEAILESQIEGSRY